MAGKSTIERNKRTIYYHCDDKQHIFETGFTVLLLFLFLLHQALQLQCLKVLVFSITSFHLTRSWMHFVKLFIFIILKSSFISFSHLIFGLPANLAGVDLALLLVNALDQE